jgi:hypothetical protein
MSITGMDLSGISVSLGCGLINQMRESRSERDIATSVPAWDMTDMMLKLNHFMRLLDEAA